ncbi:hypothetical protein CEXT_618141 [Caerostris extrusa]|uniref:Uncharacterized protein n=1 Tax=Caerostris extrusa TaxID=172846 RepID=A0AAV4T7J7_CAEEX|nr:hypothetical protein CEXT_618141 [Caerostris extrusa]
MTSLPICRSPRDFPSEVACDEWGGGRHGDASGDDAVVVGGIEGHEGNHSENDLSNANFQPSTFTYKKALISRLKAV